MVEGVQTARRAVGHRQPQTIILDLGVAAVHPIVFGRVTKVVVVQDCIVHACERVGLVFADGLGRAAVERVRFKRVATSQAVGSYTTLSTLKIICQDMRELRGMVCSL